MSKFSQGLETLEVPYALHKKNRDRLCAELRKDAGAKKALVVLRGGSADAIDDSDIEYLFKQESYFQWAFGVMEPDFYGTIDVATGYATLYLEKMPEELQPILGKIEPPEFYAKKYEVDRCCFMDSLAGDIAEFDADVTYILSGINSDSGLKAVEPKWAGMDTQRVDRGKLVEVMSELRVCKTPEEIEVMRYAVKATAEAHKALMRAVKPGMMEYQLEATFMYHMYYHFGCRFSGYNPICASGPNCAVLHYGHAAKPNDRLILDGDMCLMDCGAEYHCYDGDLTTSFPANGKFTQDQRDIYETVYAMLRGVEAAMRPGVNWIDMHTLANRICCEELTKRGFLQGSVDEMMEHNLGALFMPHGLGHLLGLDTHDVGGYPRHGRKRIMKPGYKKLRYGRDLAPGMITTVEPGCYFNTFALEPAMADPVIGKFFVKEKITAFLQFGGVRLEDNVLITEDGIEILNEVPRTIDEIEKYMAGNDDYKN